MTTEEERDRIRFEALRALVNQKADELERLLHQFREDARRITEEPDDHPRPR